MSAMSSQSKSVVVGKSGLIGCKSDSGAAKRKRKKADKALIASLEGSLYKHFKSETAETAVELSSLETCELDLASAAAAADTTGSVAATSCRDDCSSITAIPTTTTLNTTSDSNETSVVSLSAFPNYCFVSQ